MVRLSIVGLRTGVSGSGGVVYDERGGLVSGGGLKVPHSNCNRWRGRRVVNIISKIFTRCPLMLSVAWRTVLPFLLLLLIV
jgi:hypothetical protein